MMAKLKKKKKKFQFKIFTAEGAAVRTLHRAVEGEVIDPEGVRVRDPDG